MTTGSGNDSSIKSACEQTGSEFQAASAIMSKGCPGAEALHEKVRSGPSDLAELWAEVCEDEKRRLELWRRRLAEPRVLFQIANGGGQVLQAVLPPLIPTLSGRPVQTNQYEELSQNKERNDNFFSGSEDLQNTYIKAEHIKTVLRYSNQDTPLIAKMLSLPAAHTAALMAPWVLAGLAIFAKRRLFK